VPPKLSVIDEIKRSIERLKLAWQIIRLRRNGIVFGGKKTKIERPTKVKPSCEIPNLKPDCCHACGKLVFVVITLVEVRFGFYSIRRLIDDVSRASGRNFDFALY
jgi:hypothetical protein